MWWELYTSRDHARQQRLIALNNIALHHPLPVIVTPHHLILKEIQISPSISTVNPPLCDIGIVPFVAEPPVPVDASDFMGRIEPGFQSFTFLVVDIE
jgi:hypothetical protein